MRHDAIPPPPPSRDTLRTPPPELDDLDDGEPAESGVRVIDPERAARMRAEWAALWTDEADPLATLDDETGAWGTYPGSLP